MGDIKTPTDGDRCATRDLAAKIVAAVRNDEEMPLDLDVHSDDPIALVQLGDVEELALRLAQEIEALQEDERAKIHRVGDFLVAQSGTVTVDVAEIRRVYSLGVEHGIKHGAVVLDGEMTISRAGLARIEHGRADRIVADRKAVRDRLFRVLADTDLARWDDEHLLDRLVAAARDEPMPAPLPPRRLPIGMAHSLDAAEMRALRALRLAGVDLLALETLGRDPHARLMFAVVRGDAKVDPHRGDTVKVGELALVEVPKNCTIHDADAQRLAHVVSLAETIGAHWRDQEGVNAGLLEQLALATDTAPINDIIDDKET